MEPGIALAADLNSRGYLGRVHQVEADLTAPGAVSRVVGTALKEFGQLDCLVNNAGWHPPPTPIDHEDSTAESTSLNGGGGGGLERRWQWHN